MQQERNLRAWLYFLALLSLLVALWMPARTLYQRLRYSPAIEGTRDADTFIALAYAGVSAAKVRTPEEVTRQQFEQQIRALRREGFNPIGLKDVRRFYLHGDPLPRKAVLITMEQSRKNSYLETRTILRENRWKAIMFVRGDSLREKDPGALRWPILRDMQRSGTWEIGAESYSAFQRIPAGPDGETGNFLSTPQWLTAEQRLETPEEFARRIREEHERTANEFRAGMDAWPRAFAYPYGDYGQYDPRAVPTRVLNLTEVERNYGLGFTLGPFMLNTRHSDPRALNRLLVNPAWSLEQFMAIVKSGRETRPWDILQPLQAEKWLTDWGVTEHPADGSLWLQAIKPAATNTKFKPTTGALTWLMGSDLFEDWVTRMTFQIQAGQFGIRLRMRPGGEEGTRILFDESGHIRVAQKVFGAEESTVATTRDPLLVPGQPQHLELVLRGRRLFVRLNDRLLFKEPLDLMGGARPGLFGLEVWAPTPGTAATHITALEFPRPQQVLKVWRNHLNADSPNVLQELHAEAFNLAAVSPPWMDAAQTIPLVLPSWSDEALRNGAHMYGIDVLPHIALRSAELALQIPPELPAQEGLRMKADGIYLDAAQVSPEDMSTLIPWLQQVHQNIQEHNMKLAIHFPTAVTRMTSFVSIASLFPGALMAVDTPARARELEAVLPDRVVVEEHAAPASDMHLNLFYQLAARALPAEALSAEARQEANRREGFQAFQEGDYPAAIDHWTAWLEADPQSAEALEYIGLAWIQTGQLEKGLEYYTRALEAAPGQIHLAIRRAELLDQLVRPDDARQQLNLYARIFPENPDILIAQAQWLSRHKRRVEARQRVQQLVEELPHNLDARLALLHLQTEPVERYRTMRDILEAGQNSDTGIPFGHAITSKEVLTYPESGVFFDMVRQQTASASDPRQKELFETCLPITHRIVDDFSSGELSGGWIASEGIRALEYGRYELQASINQAETFLRLRQSEWMRDGALEVDVDESQGFFWLYARRSAHSMLRFGFDQEGFVHLQAWSGGELLASASRPWVRPPGRLTLRLEVRGDGIRGFINGLEMFDGPVEIPPVVAYGWWGIAPFAFDLGVARARILRLECSPAPTTLVLTPPGDATEQAAALRPFIGGISALAPAWFFQQADGSLPQDEWPDDADMLKMFAAFHRIRLLPVVDLSYDGNIEPGQLVDFIHHHRLRGVVVKRRSPPSQAWLNQLTSALESRPASVLILHTEAALWDTPDAGAHTRVEPVVRPEAGEHRLPKPKEKVHLRELPIGSVLLSPRQARYNVPLRHPEADLPPAHQDLTTPQVYLLGTDGTLTMPPPP